MTNPKLVQHVLDYRLLTSPSPVNDNAPKPMLYANKDKLIGRIDLDPCTTEDTSSDAAFSLSTALIPLRLCDNRHNNLLHINNA